MRDAKRNILLQLTGVLLSNVAYAAASGTLMQVFLNSLGFSAAQIYLHTTVKQAAQIAITLTCSRIGDRGNIFCRYTLLVVLEGLLYLFYVPLCLGEQADGSAYLLLMAVSTGNAVITGLTALLNYKLPYLIFHTGDYGTVTAAGGIIASGISIGMGFLMASLAARYTYRIVMPWVFAAAAVLIMLTGLLTLFYRPLIDPATVQEQKTQKKTDRGSVWKVLRQPLFYRLAVPNVFRGFAGGMTTVFAVIAAAELGYSEQLTSTLVSVEAAARLMGCTLFGVLSRRVCPRYTVLFSSVAFLCMPFLLIPNSPILFLCLAAVVIFGRSVEMYAVPDLLMRAVPGNIAGTYNAYRLILNNAGTLLATALASILPPSVLLPAAMVCQLIAGASYCFLPVVRKSVPSASCRL